MANKNVEIGTLEIDGKKIAPGSRPGFQYRREVRINGVRDLNAIESPRLGSDERTPRMHRRAELQEDGSGEPNNKVSFKIPVDNLSHWPMKNKLHPSPAAYIHVDYEITRDSYHIRARVIPDASLTTVSTFLHDEHIADAVGKIRGRLLELRDTNGNGLIEPSDFVVLDNGAQRQAREDVHFVGSQIASSEGEMIVEAFPNQEGLKLLAKDLATKFRALDLDSSRYLEKPEIDAAQPKRPNEVGYDRGGSSTFSLGQ